MMRVRFAPSPTGFLHVGGLRTALYNYLYARKHGGTFLLREEDTDRARYVEGALENLIEHLGWAGIKIDEGPGCGGEHGPYTQSLRCALYQRYAAQLIEQKKAYYAFDTPEELLAMRERLQAEKASIRHYPRMEMNNSLTCSAEETQAWIEQGRPYVVRFQTPRDSTDPITVEDLIHGRVSFDPQSVDDQVLLKADGFPTYHLACVVDDHHMGITHVIRGEEWLPSVPKHLLLYRAFGWEAPQMAHLPLLLNPDGSKMSKRFGDVYVEQFREKGYEPEALINYLAVLSWNQGDDREFYTLPEMIESFSLERVQKTGARFDEDKLKWLNREHLKALPEEQRVMRLRRILEAQDIEVPASEKLSEILEMMLERITTLQEIPQVAGYLFQAPTEYHEKTRKKRWKQDSAQHLQVLIEAWTGLESWTPESIQTAVAETCAQFEMKAGGLNPLMRLCLSDAPGGPDL
ncbi:MAG: glutamate--tRNA ligase, partial [Myxococcota bacterium]